MQHKTLFTSMPPLPWAYRNATINPAPDAAERKVDAAQAELWCVQERAANVDRWLLEHWPGVLAMALTAAKRTQVGKEHDDSEGPLSSISGVDGAGPLKPKSDGAHLFKGTVVPTKQ